MNRKAELIDRLVEVRDRTLDLLRQVPAEFWNRRVHEFYSPIGWHFGHVGRTEEYWACNRALAEPVLDDALTFLFDNNPENSKDNRCTLPGPDEVVRYLGETRDRALRALARADLADTDPLLADGYAWEFAYQHECQHQETIAEMLHLIQKTLPEARDWAGAPQPRWEPPHPTEWVTIPGGSFTMGTENPHSYDNELRSHTVSVEPFELARHPVTAAQWHAFMLDGGYGTPSLWSDAGWAWKQETAADRPDYWLPGSPPRAFGPFGVRELHPHEPVLGVSHHEAQAFATWSGARLPNESEWEYAAASTENRFYPWGDCPPTPSHASFGLHRWMPDPVGAHPDGASAHGVEELAGSVWEHCASPFLPYPGFRAFPYDGYSLEHMDGAHFVCRGGSFATASPILRRTFRNWYVPTYRAGFLGVRLAR